MFDYKGYTGKITNTDTGAGLFHGQVAGIQDVVTFEGKSVPDLAKAFRDSVDDYLAFCEERKESAEPPFSGKFVLRLSPDLHRRASEAANDAQMSLNSWITSAVERQLNGENGEANAMPFEEMERLAHCVAAILAEKETRTGSKQPGGKPRPKSRPTAKPAPAATR